MLPLAGLMAIKGGAIVTASDGNNLIIGGKETAIPLADYLKKDTGHQLFHPMVEDLSMDISLVLQTYAVHASSWLSYVLADTIKDVMELSLTDVSESDVDSVVTLGKLPDLSKPDTATIIRVMGVAFTMNKLVDVKVSSNSGKTAAIVYPIMEDIHNINANNQPLVLYGVKHTKRAWKAIERVMEVMCSVHTCTSSAKAAPLTHATLTVLLEFYNNFRDWLVLVGSVDVVNHSDAMAKHMPLFESKDINMLINQVPPQPGNRGSVKELARVVPEVPGVVTINAPAPTAPPVAAPVAVAAAPVAAPVAAAVAPVAVVAAPAAVAPVAAPVAPVAPPPPPGIVVGAPPSTVWGSAAVGGAVQPVQPAWGQPQQPAWGQPQQPVQNPWASPQVAPPWS